MSSQLEKKCYVIKFQSSPNGLERGLFGTTIEKKRKPTGFRELSRQKLIVGGGKVCASALIDLVVESNERGIIEDH